jgi:hypothetical protein
MLSELILENMSSLFGADMSYRPVRKWIGIWYLMNNALHALLVMLMPAGPPHGMGRHVIAVAPEDLTMVRKVLSCNTYA